MSNQYSNKNNAYDEIYGLFETFDSTKPLRTDPTAMQSVSVHHANLLDISQLFQTLIEHKNKIDIHKNVNLDRFVLFKDNSSSWQSLLKNIRNIAYIQLGLAVGKMELQKRPHAEIIEFLKKQRNNPIFCLHRGNHWFEKIGVTDSVKKINASIAVFEPKYNSKSALN